MSTIHPIKPYLIRAIYEWCIDNGWCPYLSVLEDGCSGIPVDRFENKKIVLNISNESVIDLFFNDETIQFITRFNGVSRKVIVAIDSVIAIFSRESGQGLTFISEADTNLDDKDDVSNPISQKGETSVHRSPTVGKVSLKVVK